MKSFLPGSLAAVIDDSDTGPFEDDPAYLRTLEALTTLQVMAYKLGCGSAHGPPSALAADA